MKTSVLNFIKKHELLQPKKTVLVGTSGGPDSMALLHFFLSIREAYDLKVIALSADHQLRGEGSKEDLKYVEEICKDWQVNLVKTTLDVKAYAEKHHVSTQVAAREVRYQFYKEQMERHGADYLTLGHHGDDQVETMLMSFVRSASTQAMSGIPLKRKFATGFIIRPFLCVQKEDILKYCEEASICPRLDPSNEDIDYMRNYFRKKVIPLLHKKNRNIHITVQRLSEALQADEWYLREESKKVLPQVVTFSSSNRRAMFRKDDFTKHSIALQRRIYHLILNCLYGDKLPKNLSYVHEDMFFSLFNKERGNVQIQFPNQLVIEAMYDEIVFEFQVNEELSAYEELLNVPGDVTLPDGSVIQAMIADHKITGDKNTYVCEVDAVSLPLKVRTRKPGDRMSWEGLNGTKKIKDIFIDEKIPRKFRNNWPIVTDAEDNILWLVRMKKNVRQSNKDDQVTHYLQLKFKEGNI